MNNYVGIQRSFRWKPCNNYRAIYQ